MAEKDQDNNEGLIKKAENIGKDFARKQKKAKKAFKVVSFIASNMVPILMVLASTIIVVIILAAIKNFLDFDDFKKTKESFAGDSTSLVVKAENPAGGADSSSDSDKQPSIAKVSIEKDTNTGEYVYNLDFTANVPTDMDTTGLDENEIILKVIESKGINTEDMTKEKIEVCKKFYRIAVATQNVDMRPLDKIYANQSTGELRKLNINDFNDNTVQGTVRLQRVSTKGEKYYMEYIPYDKFLNYIKDQATADEYNYIKNKFSVDYEGNISIAKWSYTKQSYQYEKNNTSITKAQLPEELKIWDNKDYYSISEEKIDYASKAWKYSMPFNFMLAILITSESAEFSEEVANLALNNNLLITIFEDYNETETQNYEMHFIYHKKQIKFIDYAIKNKANQVKERKSGVQIKNGTKDDEGKDCTTYSKDDYKVKAYEKSISNAYTIEITKVDSWIASYLKEYPTYNIKKETEDLASTEKGTYPTEPTKTTKPANPDSDNEVKSFRTKVLEDARKKYTVAYPIVSYMPSTEINISSNSIITSVQADTVQCSIPGNTKTCKITPVIIPNTITVTSGGNTFRYTKQGTGIGLSYITYAPIYNSSEVICTVSNLVINEYTKQDKITTGKNVTTTYETSNEATTKTDIKLQDSNGKWEGFLGVYDEDRFKKEKSLIENKEYSFYKYLQLSEDTVDLEEYMKMLFYIYENGIDSLSEYEEYINQLKDLYGNEEFMRLNSGVYGSGSGWWWPIGSQTTEKINGKLFATGTPYSIYITSHYQRNRPDPLTGEIKFHAGIDIGAPNGTPVIASRSGTVIVDGNYGSWGNTVVLKHGDGTCSRYAHLSSEIVTSGENVEQGQVIGYVGSTGHSSGNHLDFRIFVNDSDKGFYITNSVDPLSDGYLNPNDPRPVAVEGVSSTLRDWLWGMEGGSEYIKGDKWIVFDPEGNDNTMNLAHGMVIASADGATSWYPEVIPGKIHEGQIVTEEQANKIWEIKMKEFINAIDSSCAKYNVTLNTNQHDALVSCIYRLGYGENQNDKLVYAYKNGGNAGLWNVMKETYNRSYSKGTKNRLAEEYELFVKGDYTYQYDFGKYDRLCANPNI